MTKFYQELAKPSKDLKRYRRYLSSEKKLGDQELNPLDSTDQRCSFVSQSIVWDIDENSTLDRY